MAIENFSADAQSIERGTNLYAQVSTDLQGGLQGLKQDTGTGTATNYLPEVRFIDIRVEPGSPADPNGAEARRKAAEESRQPKQQEAASQKDRSAGENVKRPADEVPPQVQPNREAMEGPSRKVDSNTQSKGNEGPTRQGDHKEQPPQAKEAPTRPGTGSEAPTRKEESTRKEQPGQGSKGSEQKEQPKKGSADCGKDYTVDGDKVMSKPTSWKPDTELKTKQGQEWNKKAQEQRDKPLKTDANGNYEVKYGDSLWGIAERSVKERTGKQPSPSATFEEMRRIVGMNADKLGSQSNWQMIKPGMQLRVKGDNPCEVPGKVSDGGNGTPKVSESPNQKTPGKVSEEQPKQKAPGRVSEEQPKQKPDHNGAPGNRQRTEQRTNGQNGDQQNRRQEGSNDSPTEGPEKSGERTKTGDKGQKVTVDAQNRVTKVDYQNGMHVKLEYSGNSKEISRATVTGNGKETVMVKNGDHYKVLENGKETSDKVLRIELHDDGSAVITGTSFGMKGQKIVSADGSTKDKILGAA